MMIEPEKPIVSLVVAVADNGVIGREGMLPWRIKSDLKRFRALTMGHPLIMGRKTYQSIGRPLDGRDSIVLTRDADLLAEPNPAVFLATQFDGAIRIANERAVERGVNEVFVIGGAMVFALAMPVAQRIYLTRVHGAPAGNVFWNPPREGWREGVRQPRAIENGDDHEVTDIILERTPIS